MRPLEVAKRRCRPYQMGRCLRSLEQIERVDTRSRRLQGEAVIRSQFVLVWLAILDDRLCSTYLMIDRLRLPHRQIQCLKEV